MAAMTFNPPHPVDVLKDQGVTMTAAQETELRRIIDHDLADFEHQMIYGNSKTLQIPIGVLCGQSLLASTHDAFVKCDLPPPKPWIQKAFKRAPKRLGMKR